MKSKKISNKKMIYLKDKDYKIVTDLKLIKKENRNYCI